MSVVVYKDGVLAADSKAYGGKYQTSPGWKRKAHRLEDGTRVGVVSAVLGEPERFVAWLRAGGDPEAWKGEKPDVRALVVRPNGALFLHDESLTPSVPIECEFYAIGSGGEFAMGAMAMGADVEEAIRVAIRFDVNSGGEPLVLRPEA